MKKCRFWLVALVLLILHRIQLIEFLAPLAMDKVNADAFAEAHQDLVNLARLAADQ